MVSRPDLQQKPHHRLCLLFVIAILLSSKAQLHLFTVEQVAGKAGRQQPHQQQQQQHPLIIYRQGAVRPATCLQVGTYGRLAGPSDRAPAPRCVGPAGRQRSDLYARPQFSSSGSDAYRTALVGGRAYQVRRIHPSVCRPADADRVAFLVAGHRPQVRPYAQTVCCGVVERFVVEQVNDKSAAKSNGRSSSHLRMRG